MIDLAQVFSQWVQFSKSCKGKIIVSIPYVSWKENRHDIASRSITGTGESLELACGDFMNNAKGKLLYGDNKIFYGENRPEYICV